jgi:mannose-6-phosphate isomerase-like protein (cupin superfamily)
MGKARRKLLLCLLIGSSVAAQERTVDPTWLHRSLALSGSTGENLSSGTCHYQAVLGQGDLDSRILRTMTRFGELALGPNGKCEAAAYDRQEEIYFVLDGNVTLNYGDQPYPMRTHDFTYVPPGQRHSVANESGQAAHVLLMGFQIPPRTSIGQASSRPKIINLETVKEETVEGHPTSVLYKLLIGPRTAARDAIDDAYVVTSLFWMDFAPGGTNFPHHHETAEEVYLVMNGEGQMVAGSGMDGLEARFPAKAGDVYYFRPNCTVGFYNENKPGSKAFILAVRAKIPLPENDD